MDSGFDSPSPAITATIPAAAALPEQSPLPAVFFELAIQRRLADSKKARSFELVVVSDLQRVNDGLFLHHCQRNNFPACAG